MEPAALPARGACKASQNGRPRRAHQACTRSLPPASSHPLARLLPAAPPLKKRAAGQAKGDEGGGRGWRQAKRRRQH